MDDLETGLGASGGSQLVVGVGAAGEASEEDEVPGGGAAPAPAVGADRNADVPDPVIVRPADGIAEAEEDRVEARHVSNRSFPDFLEMFG